MNPTQQIREEVLLQLYGAGLGISLSTKQMQRTAERAGITAPELEFVQASLFHVGQGLAAREVSATGEVRFTITTAGVLKKENG